MSTGTEALEFGLMQQMTQEQRMTFQMQYLSKRKDPTTATILALLCLSRFYLGEVVLGILQWIANFFVVALVWALIDLATAGSRTRKYNARTAEEIATWVIGSGARAMLGPNPNPAFCHKCGARNPATASFCGASGQL